MARRAVLVVVLVMLACMAPVPAAALDGWSHRLAVAIDPATPQPGFPVRVDLDASTFPYADADPDGDDIRFTDAGDNLFGYVIETWNPAGASVLWVRVPSQDTSLMYIHFGNDAAAPASNPAEVWDLWEDWEQGVNGWTGAPGCSPNGSAITWGRGLVSTACSNIGYFFPSEPAAAGNGEYIYEGTDSWYMDYEGQANSTQSLWKEMTLASVNAQLSFRMTYNTADAGNIVVEVLDTSNILMGTLMAVGPLNTASWAEYSFDLSGVATSTTIRLRFRHYTGNDAGGLVALDLIKIRGAAAQESVGVITQVETPGPITLPSVDSNGAYDVSWEASADAGVTYVLEEATDAGFTTGLRTAYTGTDLFTQITGRLRGTTYWYRVKATKADYVDSDWVTSANGCWISLSRDDFTGDGNVDILLRNLHSGSFVIWAMDGTAVLPAPESGVLPYGLSATWRVEGTGDFDGDGMSDVLLRNVHTGSFVIWLMDGTTVRLPESGALPYSLSATTWRVEGTGDFDGDGMVDILIRNAGTGTFVMWLMDGTTVRLPESGALPYALPVANWKVEGTGDFDGDNMSDVLLRNVHTGTFVMWLMDGTTVRLPESGALVYSLSSATWKVEGTGDFDGDGMADILIRNAGTGTFVMWLMDGTTVRLPESGALPYALPVTTWQVEMTGDFDGDAMCDVLVRNKGTGSFVMWLMDGTTVRLPESGALPYALPVATWKVEN